MGALEIASEVVKVVRQIDNIELHRKILDLQSEIVQLVEEKQELVKENEELKDKWTIQGELEFRDNAYWKASGEGPFCPHCWDKDHSLMHMTGNDQGHRCHACRYSIMTGKWFKGT